MPLRDDLLNPIAGDNPSGANLRYAPVFDKLKEARREEDDAPQGEWKRERKVADCKAVIKLAGETLAAQVYPLMLMHASAWLERQAGVVLGLKWARNLGVTREQAVEVLDLVFFWGGEFKMAAVLTDEVVALIKDWQ